RRPPAPHHTIGVEIPAHPVHAAVLFWAVIHHQHDQVRPAGAGHIRDRHPRTLVLPREPVRHLRPRRPPPRHHTTAAHLPAHPPLTTPSASRSRPTRYTPRFCSGPLSTINTTRSGRPDPVTSATALSTPWFSHENQSGTAENAAGSGMPTSGQSTGWPRAKSDGTTISDPAAAIGMRAGGSWACARPATQQPPTGSSAA